MKTYIALFRGINVGGKNTLPMKELAVILEDLGARKVKTYIQSGNVLFASDETNQEKLTSLLEEIVSQTFHYPARIVLRSSVHMQQIIEKVPDD